MNREDLKNYIYNQKWIKGQMELYTEQMELAKGLKATVIDGMPKAQNKPNYKIEELIDKYNNIIDHLNKLQDKQNEIVKQLNQMESSEYRYILFNKYIKGNTIEEIAVELDKDYKYTCTLHGYALNEFDKLDKNFSKMEK